MNLQPPSHVTLVITRKQAAFLYNVLSDNARAWNAPLRAILHQCVNATDAHNARLELTGRQ